MTTLKKIKLTQLSKAELGRQEMLHIKGGGCNCACANSNTYSNGHANWEGGLNSPGEGQCYIGYYYIFIGDSSDM